MATTSVQKSGFVNMNSLLSSVADDLVAAGFTLIYDGRGVDEFITLEASPVNDPLHATQPWRVRFDLNHERIIEKFDDQITGNGNIPSVEVNRTVGQIIVGTPIQLPDLGGFAVIPNRQLQEPEASEPDYVVGEIEGVLEYWKINHARPCSYVLSVTNRGFALSITTDAEDEGRGQFWMCVQRLVNAVTGDILLDGHTPVVCFYFKEMDAIYTTTTGSGKYNWSSRYEELANKHVRQIVVRESDVHAPSVPTIVSSFENYSGKSINKVKQISISNQDEYILSVPDGVNTHRHLYHNDRMDMLTYISANIIPETVTADVNMHGEAIVSFDQGTDEFSVGNKLIGDNSSSSGVIYRVTVNSGDWLTNNAEGVLHIKQLNGDFSAEPITSYNEQGQVVGNGNAIDTTPDMRKYQAQRCTGGYVLVEDGYTEGSRILFITENGDI